MAKKFKVGDIVKYKEDYLNYRPKEDRKDKYTILAVDSNGYGYLYKKNNPKGIEGNDYDDFTWKVQPHEVDIIERKEIKCNYLLKYDLEQDPIEEFETLKEVEKRIQELVENKDRSGLDTESVVIYEIKKVTLVKISTQVKISYK